MKSVTLLTHAGSAATVGTAFGPVPQSESLTGQLVIDVPFWDETSTADLEVEIYDPVGAAWVNWFVANQDYLVLLASPFNQIVEVPLGFQIRVKTVGTGHADDELTATLFYE